MSNTATVTSTEQSPTTKVTPLVRHSRRDSWGRAIMLWERDHKRGYQFEDGEVRVFAEGYYGLLEPARKPDPLLRNQLLQKARDSGLLDFMQKGKSGGRSSRPSGPKPTVADQITLFSNEFVAGFLDEEWVKAYRSRDKGRIKRLRDPAIADAKQRLSKAGLDECIEAGRYPEVFARVVEVLAKTDLVSRKQLEIFEGVEVDRDLAVAMRDYLHDVRTGELEPMARLRRDLARFGVRKIAWTALTAPRALLHPDDHMCVRPSMLRAQAKNIMPRHAPGRQPNADDYARCLEVAMTVRKQLTEADLAPRDLFDVTDFMWATLRPAVKDDLQNAMLERTTDTSLS